MVHWKAEHKSGGLCSNLQVDCGIEELSTLTHDDGTETRALVSTLLLGQLMHPVHLNPAFIVTGFQQ